MTNVLLALVTESALLWLWCDKWTEPKFNDLITTTNKTTTVWAWRLNNKDRTVNSFYCAEKYSTDTLTFTSSAEVAVCRTTTVYYYKYPVHTRIVI